MKNFNQSYIGLRSDLIKYISGKNNNVLDVGCANGTNGNYLLENDIAEIVYGIEFDKEMSAVAENNYSKVFAGDLNSKSFRSDILKCNIKFDYILFGDILEHLLDPYAVLKELKTLLKPDGKIIISLPNIAHVETFIQLFVKGTWPKNSRGIFDATHLRWFTKKDVESLVAHSELNLDVYEAKLRARDAIGSKFNWKYNIIKKINKEWVTFQHIIVCSHV
ncbi:class I SAM-dependent methyltransferase [Algibacter pacificus]|uniref:class I SAM-dependent methyltransferase n=1 Tax=Algibacter pacificus TaxID=2599389 RepID=UPI0011C8B9F0|nr:class I SAM-dependent methyltransferase [Algibacter pacificus]